MFATTDNPGMALIVIFALFLFALAGCAAPAILQPTPHVYIFHAKWCQYCPTDADIEALAEQYPAIDVWNVDVDERPQLAKRFDVHAVPRFVMFPDAGQEPQVTDNMGECKAWLRWESEHLAAGAR